ncbi:VgrG-related protein [Kineosporia mesophila]|uniref:VgrG-related protein n=1 Tax=Kineosporia mesophila TaxID=566012 RepID=A0ABP6ZBR5_9ACTN|nr:VgrG-related protein [Kineosporia mesophila]MCD5352028.1 VgrG-related protein [Kineosporia mesophila]
MSQKTYTSVLQVRVGGTELPPRLAGLMVDAWVDASVNVPAAFRLAFSNPGGDMFGTFSVLAVGAKAELIPVTDGRPGKPLLTGEITGVEMDVDAAGRSVVVRGYDPGHRLLRNRRVAGYPNQTASEIVRRVARQNGLNLGTIDATRTVYALATQPNVTDWEFLARLARENDVNLYFDRLGKLQFTALRAASGAPAGSTPARRSPYVLEFGANTLNGRAGVTAGGQVKTVSVRGWDVKTRKPLVQDASATRTDDIQADITPGELISKFGASEVVDASVPYGTQSQVRHAATALAGDLAGSFAEVELTVTGDPELQPGTPVALKNAGYPFEGKYTVTGVRHVFASGRPYTTQVSVTGRQFRSLYGLASGGEPAPAMNGVVVALVSNVQDPLKMGRVKLQFPWLSDSYESDWARVAQFGGVAGGGLMLPDVRDEVLVAFDRGNLEHPYVLAGLYNGVDRPTPDPDRTDAVNLRSGDVNWRSLSDRSGNMLELMDTRAGNRGVRLRSGDGALTVHLDRGRTSLSIDSRGTVRIHGSRSVEVASEGDLTLRAGRAVNIQAGAAVNVNAAGRIAMNTAGAMNLSAGAAATINAGAAATINAAGTASIQAGAAVGIRAVGNANITALSVVLTGIPIRNGIPF